MHETPSVTAAAAAATAVDIVNAKCCTFSLFFFLVFSMRIYPVVTDKNERYNQLDWVQLTLILRKKKKE